MIVLDEFTALAGAILLTINLGVTIWNFVTSGSKKNGQKIDALGKNLNDRLNQSEADAADRIRSMDQEVNRHEKRIELLENEMRHLPTKDQLHELRNSITALEGSMKEIAASLSATAHTVANIDTYLRKDDSKP